MQKRERLKCWRGNPSRLSVKYGLYQDMFRRGPQRRLKYCIFFDEALPNWKNPDVFPYQTKKMVPLGDVREEYLHWLNAQSRITFFGGSKRFVVAYRQVGGKQAFALLDKDFNVKETQEYTGRIVGIVGKEIFIWEDQQLRVKPW